MNYYIKIQLNMSVDLYLGSCIFFKDRSPNYFYRLRNSNTTIKK